MAHPGEEVEGQEVLAAVRVDFPFATDQNVQSKLQLDLRKLARKHASVFS